MLTGVPTQINRSARLVTLRHPNAMDCTVFQKVVNRTAATSMGGLPTIEGVGLLDSEDEADYEYVERGDAKIVFMGQFVGEGGNWTDSDNGIIYGSPPIEALIECVLEPEAATATSNVPLSGATPLVIGAVTATAGMRIKLTGQTNTAQNGTYTVSFGDGTYTLTAASAFFVTGKPDMISVEPGAGIVLIYEVLGENSNVNIPPHVRRYILAARADQANGIG